MIKTRCDRCGEGYQWGTEHVCPKGVGDAFAVTILSAFKETVSSAGTAVSSSHGLPSTKEGFDSETRRVGKFDRTAYQREYMRDYMRKRRARERAEKDGQ